MSSGIACSHSQYSLVIGCMSPNLAACNACRLKLRNSLGYTAIDMAVQYDHPWIVEGLSSRWQKLYKEPYPGGPKPFRAN